MRNIYYISAILLGILISACSEETAKKEEDIEKTSKTSAFDTTKLRLFSLKDHELDISIYVPNNTYKDEEGIERYNPPNITHNDGEARWEITMPSDKDWHMVIEEMGDEEVSLEKEKNRQSNTIFDRDYIEEGENYFLFTEGINQEKSTLENDDETISPDYHFYCLREINGYNLVFKSHEMGDFYKPTIKAMLTSAICAK